MDEAVVSAFRRGMEEAARLCDEEVRSADYFIRRGNNLHKIGVPKHEHFDHLESMKQEAVALAGTIRNFAADDEWVSAVLRPPLPGGSGP